MNIDTRARSRQPSPTLARLPPLTALRAFVATARHLNFTGAADELHVTSAAVGQQIRLLEEHLGHALFVRNRGGLQLTTAGRALMPGLTSAFDTLLETLSALAEEPGRAPIRIVAPSSFAGKWLAPRLATLQAAGPRLDVQVDVCSRGVDLFRDDADCIIGYGAGNVSGLVVDRLFGEAVVPVCSPAFAQRHGLSGNPPALAGAPLLHEQGPSPDPACPDWGAWLRLFGLPMHLAESGITLSQSSLVLDAAVAGQGVGLAKLRLAEADLLSGRLVVPFGEPQPVDFFYFFAATPLKAKSPQVRQFRHWLLSETRAARTDVDRWPPDGPYPASGAHADTPAIAAE
ncbi:LysR substrate-binding domain-containing protein [Pseudochelatococcus lubricantis]|uniref:LysR substrate-binding domain-containing protein n=1 Tax=Pseudochelatococcus lubricantis TaxID=1538102 RepID=UPI0035EF1877